MVGEIINPCTYKGVHEKHIWKVVGMSYQFKCPGVDQWLFDYMAGRVDLQGRKK